MTANKHNAARLLGGFLLTLSLMVTASAQTPERLILPDLENVGILVGVSHQAFLFDNQVGVSQLFRATDQSLHLFSYLIAEREAGKTFDLSPEFGTGGFLQPGLFAAAGGADGQLLVYGPAANGALKILSLHVDRAGRMTPRWAKEFPGANVLRAAFNLNKTAAAVLLGSPNRLRVHLLSSEDGAEISTLPVDFNPFSFGFFFDASATAAMSLPLRRYLLFPPQIIAWILSVKLRIQRSPVPMLSESAPTENS